MSAKTQIPNAAEITKSPSVALPGARTALILLLAINLFNYIDRYVLSAVVENIKSELSMPAMPTWLEQVFGSNPKNMLVGLLAMAFMATYMLTAPIFGRLAVRVSRWWLVGIGVAVWSLASGASGLAATFGILFLTRCLVGVGEGAYGPIAPDMISDLYPASIRGRVLAWFYMAIPVGSALGFVLGGAIAGTLGWRWAFYFVVAPGLVLAVLCWFMKEPTRGLSDRANRKDEGGRVKDDSECDQVDSSFNLPPPSLRSSIRILLKTPSYVLVTLGMTAMTFAMGGIGFWMPDYISEFRGYGNQSQVSMTFGVIVVVSGLGATLLGGYVGDRLRSRFPGSYFLVSGLAMLIGFPFSIAMLYVPFPWAWVFVFLACFCLFFNTGPSNTILANVSHPSIRASAFALNILVIHALGDVISPLIIGAITDASGNDMNRAFLLVSGMILIGGVLWLWGTRYLERDTQLAPTRFG
jgi:MFS family permease